MPIGLGIGLAITRGGTPGFSLTAPVLAFASATDPDSDNTQDFNADFTGQTLTGYAIQLVGTYGSATVSEPYDVDEKNDIDSTENTAALVTFAPGAAPDGLVAYKCRVVVSAANPTPLSPWSNTVSKTITVPAIITSEATVDNEEGSVLAHSLTANESVTWSLNGGADVALFEISGSTLRWASNGVQDFATPLDVGANNVYNVTVRATDTDTNTTDQNIAVTVTELGAYAAEAVRFNSDRLTRGAALTGIADSKVGLISFWINMKGGDGATYHVICEDLNNGAKFAIHRNGDGNNRIYVSGGANLLLQSSAAFTTSSGWQHFLASWDLATGVGQVYVNDSSSLLAGSTLNNVNIDYDGIANWAIGGRTGGTLYLDADVADLYINIVTHLDLSNSTNRRKFITAGLKPVDLGSDGSTPTGTAPIMFFKNSLATWHTNVGSGGGFTVTAGGLAAGASSPSD